jgi:hypothetical protein
VTNNTKRKFFSSPLTNKNTLHAKHLDLSLVSKDLPTKLISYNKLGVVIFAPQRLKLSDDRLLGILNFI